MLTKKIHMYTTLSLASFEPQTVVVPVYEADGISMCYCASVRIEKSSSGWIKSNFKRLFYAV